MSRCKYFKEIPNLFGDPNEGQLRQYQALNRVSLKTLMKIESYQSSKVS